MVSLSRDATPPNPVGASGPYTLGFSGTRRLHRGPRTDHRNRPGPLHRGRHGFTNSTILGHLPRPTPDLVETDGVGVQWGPGWVSRVPVYDRFRPPSEGPTWTVVVGPPVVRGPGAVSWYTYCPTPRSCRSWTAGVPGGWFCYDTRGSTPRTEGPQKCCGRTGVRHRADGTGGFRPTTPLLSRVFPWD